MQIVSIHCQMGNQMFQYAFGLGLKGIMLPFCSTYEYPFEHYYFHINPLLRYVYRHPKMTHTYRCICKKLIHNKITNNDRQTLVTPPTTGSHYYEGFYQRILINGQVRFKKSNISSN